MVQNLVSRTFVVHAPAPGRPDYFACQPAGRFGSPVLTSRTDRPVDCRNCLRVQTLDCGCPKKIVADEGHQEGCARFIRDK
jgi:hypothetical protein